MPDPTNAAPFLMPTTLLSFTPNGGRFGRIATTVEIEVRRQVACELEKSMSLKDPGGWPDYDEITKAINDMDNVTFLRIVSDAVENRLTGALAARY
jgi:hypothetical protein